MEERCSRCGRVAPPPIAGPGGQAAQGWTDYETDAGQPETVCPDCHTDAEIDAAEAFAAPPWPEALWSVLRLIEVRERRHGITSWWHGRIP